MTDNATAPSDRPSSRPGGTGEPAPLGRAASRAREAIIALIDGGVFAPGHKLPSERELAVQVSVSRAVLRDALRSLEREARVESSPWRGWFVTKPHMAERVTLISFSDMARARGLTPGARVVLRQTRTATPSEEVALSLPPSSQVHEIHRVRTLDGVPTCYDTSVIPTAVAAGITEVNLEDRSLYETLEALAGVRIVRSDYTVKAEAVGPDIADYLNIDPGAPVLIGEEVASDVARTPIVLGRVTYRHDSYEFQATLYRPYDAAGDA